jgi:FKBP-type peptidyl-prolyl cis-trans isomerase FklB
MKFQPIAGLMLLAASPLALAMDASLNTDKKQLSYTIGFQIAQQIRGDSLDVDPATLSQAIADVLSGAPPKMAPPEMQATMEKLQQQKMAQQKSMGEKNLKDGQAFLDKNKKEAGVTVTASGLQYKVLKKGAGKKPKPTDTVTVNYKGTLISGVEFDSSYSRGQPASFPVNQVIKGWQEILPMMEEGAKWEIVIPANMAYGERGTGGPIGPNETLKFEIELLSIGDSAAKAPAAK